MTRSRYARRLCRAVCLWTILRVGAAGCTNTTLEDLAKPVLAVNRTHRSIVYIAVDANRQGWYDAGLEGPLDLEERRRLTNDEAAQLQATFDALPFNPTAPCPARTTPAVEGSVLFLSLPAAGGRDSSQGCFGDDGLLLPPWRAALDLMVTLVPAEAP